MPWGNNPDFLSLLGALLISLISGFISIAQRVISGHRANVLWVATEFLTAILCGYLMWDAYPKLVDSLPSWATLPVMVALASHVGGRSFQLLEGQLLKRYRVDPSS